MKNLTFTLIFLIIQTLIVSQTEEYSFSVKIIGKGKPIILIPGLASSGDVWEQTANVLQKRYECHLLTFAGFAKNKPVNIDQGFLPKMEQEIIKYIKNELKEKPTLIGHSLGGFVSLSIASKETQLLSKIIIVDSYPFLPSAYNPDATTESMLPQAQTMKKMLHIMNDSMFIQQQKLVLPTMITDSINVEKALEWAMQSDRATIAQAMYELMTTDLRAELAKITIPILVMGSWYGAKDYGLTKEIVKTNYENQFFKAKNCKILVAETARHFIMWDEPEWFLETIKTFCENEK